MQDHRSRYISKKTAGKALKIPFFLFCILVFAAVASNCLASSMNVVYAGFAFRGNAAAIQKNYPHVFEISELVREDGRKILEKELADRVLGLSLSGINLIPVGGDDDSLVLACSLDNESINIEGYDDGYKIVIDLGAQILLFDIAEKKLIASYPFALQLIDFSAKKPTDTMIHERIDSLLRTKKYDMNLLDDFVDLLKGIELKKTYGGTIKVTEVAVEDKAMSFLPPRFKDNIDSFKVFIAQDFGKYLSKNQAVSILPYTIGSDIGGKMTIRFINAETVDLSIPEPQFAIKLTILGFKKVETAKKAAGSNWVYGAYANISIEQPLLGKTYIDETVKHGVNKKIPSVQKTVNDWPVFQECAGDLFDKLTKNFSEDGNYKKVKEVIEKCR